MIMEFGTRGIAMMHKAADLDFVLIDMEHTGFDAERIADLIAFYKATDVASSSSACRSRSIISSPAPWMPAPSG